MFDSHRTPVAMAALGIAFLVGITSCSSSSPSASDFLHESTILVMQIDMAEVRSLSTAFQEGEFGNDMERALFGESQVVTLAGSRFGGGILGVSYFETDGSIDLSAFMEGPEIAFDDDGGLNLNSSLSWRMEEDGDYYVEVGVIGSSESDGRHSVQTDDDGGSGLDARISLAAEIEGEYYLRVRGYSDGSWAGTVTGQVGSTRIQESVRGDEVLGPFMLKVGDRVDVRTNLSSGDPMLELEMEAPNLVFGTLGDTEFREVDVLPNARFGPFPLSAGDPVKLTTNVGWDATLRLQGAPEPTRIGEVDVYPVQGGRNGAQLRPGLYVVADPEFPLSELIDGSGLGPLLNREFESLVGGADWGEIWSLATADVDELGSNFESAIDELDVVSPSDTRVLREITGISASAGTSGGGLRLVATLYFDQEDHRRRAGLLMEDVSAGVQSDLTVPRAVRDLFSGISIGDRGGNGLSIEMKATQATIGDLELDPEDFLTNLMEAFSSL